MDFDKLCAIAISRLKLSYSEFYELSPKEFFMALKDHSRQRVEGKEVLVRAIWESTRMNMLIIANVNRKTPIKDARRLIKLPWDDESKDQKEMNPEVLKKILLHDMSKDERKKRRKYTKQNPWKKDKHDISVRQKNNKS